MDVAEIARSLPDFVYILTYSGLAVVVLLVVGALFVLMTRRSAVRPTSRGWPGRIFYLMFLISVIVLSASAFGSIYRFGGMSGYALITHLFAAGAFVFLLLALAVVYLPRPQRDSRNDPDRWWLTRLSAWILVLSGIVTSGTMLLAMLPLLSTDGLLTTTVLHRYAGLCVVVAGVFHAFGLLSTRLGWR